MIKEADREFASNFQLFTATKQGDLDEVLSCIAAGADVKFADYDNETALHLACDVGDLGKL